MAVITPVGQVGQVGFDWVPKDPKKEMVKTASTNDESAEVSTKGTAPKAQKVVEAKTDKDLLYAIAKKVVKAQFDDTEVDDTDDDDYDGTMDEVEEISDEIDDVVEDVTDDATEDAIEEDSGGDVQEAVAELVEKAEAADQVAESVQNAVSKVEEAVEGVKDAIGGVSEDIVDEFPEASDEAIIEVDIVDEEPEVGGEDIIIESEPEDDGCCGGAFTGSDKEALQTEAGADQFVKTSRISPSTRKKVLKFWKDDLGYVADYAKLMTTNYEK